MPKPPRPAKPRAVKACKAWAAHAGNKVHPGWVFQRKSDAEHTARIELACKSGSECVVPVLVVPQREPTEEELDALAEDLTFPVENWNDWLEVARSAWRLGARPEGGER